MVQTAALGLMTLGRLYISLFMSVTLHGAVYSDLSTIGADRCDHRLFIGSKTADASFDQPISTLLLFIAFFINHVRLQTNVWWLASFLLSTICYLRASSRTSASSLFVHVMVFGSFLCTPFSCCWILFPLCQGSGLSFQHAAM